MVSSNRHYGFTVIELLVAMTILIMMVLMMTRVFTETSRLWSQGEAKVNTAMQGRAILDFVVREMTQAIADDIVSFKINSPDARKPEDRPRYGGMVYGEIDADEVCFVAPVRLATGGDFTRNAHQFVYFVTNMFDSAGNIMDNRYQLVRLRKTAAMWSSLANLNMSAYKNPKWYEYMSEPQLVRRDMETVANNVVGFEIWAYAPSTNGMNGYANGFAYNSTTHNHLLPAWADVYLELLGEDEAKKAALMMSGDKEAARNFVAQNVRRFTTRVFFPNRERAFIMNDEP